MTGTNATMEWPTAKGARAHWWRRLDPLADGQGYVDAAGKPVPSASVHARLGKIRIPPAWRAVLISPHKRARIRVIGIDDAGRTQYIYDPAASARNARKKFERIERFGEHLPRLREITTQHLGLPGLPRTKVLAVVVRLMNSLHFRVGSERNARRYRTYGVSTLRRHHLRFHEDGAVEFAFTGKHKVRAKTLLLDSTLTHILRELAALEGRQLFQWRDAQGQLHRITERDVNAYVKECTAPEFSAKDFRTWAGTLLVAQELARVGPADTITQQKRNIAAAVRAAAARLFNTPAVCRKAYLHPTVVDLYQRGVTLDVVPINGHHIQSVEAGFDPQEAQLLEMLALRKHIRHLRGRVTPPTPVAELVAPNTPTIACAL